jgi:hypothetical protein
MNTLLNNIWGHNINLNEILETDSLRAILPWIIIWQATMHTGCGNSAVKQLSCTVPMYSIPSNLITISSTSLRDSMNIWEKLRKYGVLFNSKRKISKPETYPTCLIPLSKWTSEHVNRRIGLAFSNDSFKREIIHLWKFCASEIVILITRFLNLSASSKNSKFYE